MQIKYCYKSYQLFLNSLNIQTDQFFQHSQMNNVSPFYLSLFTDPNEFPDFMKIINFQVNDNQILTETFQTIINTHKTHPELENSALIRFLNSDDYFDKIVEIFNMSRGDYATDVQRRLFILFFMTSFPLSKEKQQILVNFFQQLFNEYTFSLNYSLVLLILDNMVYSFKDFGELFISLFFDKIIIESEKDRNKQEINIFLGFLNRLFGLMVKEYYSFIYIFERTIPILMHLGMKSSLSQILSLNLIRLFIQHSEKTFKTSLIRNDISSFLLTLASTSQTCLYIADNNFSSLENFYLPIDNLTFLFHSLEKKLMYSETNLHEIIHSFSSVATLYANNNSPMYHHNFKLILKYIKEHIHYMTGDDWIHFADIACLPVFSKNRISCLLFLIDTEIHIFSTLSSELQCHIITSLIETFDSLSFCQRHKISLFFEYLSIHEVNQQKLNNIIISLLQDEIIENLLNCNDDENGQFIYKTIITLSQRETKSQNLT